MHISSMRIKWDSECFGMFCLNAWGRIIPFFPSLAWEHSFKDYKGPGWNAESLSRQHTLSTGINIRIVIFSYSIQGEMRSRSGWDHWSTIWWKCTDLRREWTFLWSSGRVRWELRVTASCLHSGHPLVIFSKYCLKGWGKSTRFYIKIKALV